MRYLLLLGMVLLSACAGHQKVVAYGPMSARGGYQEDELPLALMAALGGKRTLGPPPTN
jgi:hypothetical protein